MYEVEPWRDASPEEEELEASERRFHLLFRQVEQLLQWCGDEVAVSGRAAVMGEKSRDYVTAARVAGAGNFRLMFRTILPNCTAPLIVQATLSFSSAILDAAALGFLGLGVQPPTPEWGTMLASARDYIERAWWVVSLPGLAILLSVLAINLFGDGLRDALDPKLKNAA